MKYNSVYVVNAPSWILHYLGNDIIDGFTALGYQCRQGSRDEYQGEDICFHMWWRQAVPMKAAKANAVFITHTDDKLKEKEVESLKNDFDFFFPMSAEDGKFLIELGFNPDKVFGFNLPVRNTYVKPITFGIFSNCYKTTHVKNEHWLVEYCCNNDISKLANFVFIGKDWDSVAIELSSHDISYTWMNISRKMPYEYMYQQLELSRVDYYLYMGMDGGAMGSYDAYAMGVKLCIADDGFHQGIPDIAYKFTTKEEFFRQMDEILARQKRKIDFFRENSPQNYVKKISMAFEGLSYSQILENPQELNYCVVEKRRKNYFPLTKNRIVDHISSLLQKMKRRHMSN